MGIPSQSPHSAEFLLEKAVLQAACKIIDSDRSREIETLIREDDWLGYLELSIDHGKYEDVGDLLTIT